MKLTLRKWNLPYKEFHNELVCLARLDRYNKTRYSRRKKQGGAAGAGLPRSPRESGGLLRHDPQR